MTPIQNVQRYLDAWNQHDATRIAGCFADNSTYTDPAAGTLAGPAIADYADALFAAFPDLRFDVNRLDAICSDRIIVEWTMLGTNQGSFAGGPPTGREIALPGVDVITTNGCGITAVQGYFDQRTLVDQLGMQVIVQPHAIGPFTFGRASRVHGGNPAAPGALSLTWLDVNSEAERETVLDYTRRIAVEMTRMDGFISWIGITIGQRMFTLTAWENAADVEQLRRNETHREAVRVFFGPDLARNAQTAVFSAHHLNTLWQRCSGCNQMIDTSGASKTCECGAPLPEPTIYA